MPAFTRPLTTLIIAAAALAAPGARTAFAEIRWETSLDRASAAARESNQPMLIEFWATWCEPCMEMDRDVYSDERIVSAIAKVRPVRVDIDRERAIARKYDITGTPTLVVTDSFGHELFRYAGALPLDRMLKLLDALPGDVRRLNELSTVLAATKNDFAALLEMGRELREIGFYRASNEYYARALKTREGKRPGPERSAVLLAMEQNATELRLFADAARYRAMRGG
jgi:thiol-disulfide isomerase/thioredoxin